MATDKSWHIIYPAYINSNRTVQKGRRITKEKCVRDPTCTEIADVLKANKAFVVMLEANKLYPRENDKETSSCRGRVKYQLEDLAAPFKNKKDVLLYLGETIPKLKTRAKGGNPSGAEQNSSTTQGKKKRGRK